MLVTNKKHEKDIAEIREDIRAMYEYFNKHLTLIESQVMAIAAKVEGKKAKRGKKA